MNPTLRRHLKKAFGLTPEALDSLLQGCLANAAPDSNEAILASGLGTLLTRIDDSYEQFERDLELKRVREGRGVVQHSHVDDIY